MVVFLLMNLLVLISSFLITYRLFFIPDLIDSLLCWFVLYFAQIVLSELILGLLGMLYLKNIILLNLVFLLVIRLAVKNRPSSWRGNGISAIIKEFLENKITFFIISVILCFSLVKISINLVNPPFGWDDLNYHFTFPVEWLKHGNLDTPITISDDPSPSYYPVNGSLFFFWLILPLKNVFLADLGQVPFFILAFLSVYNISRKTGLEKKLSFYTASLFLLIPNFFKQLQIAYVDVMVAALFLVCINFLFLLNKKFSWVYTLIYSLSLGLLLGTKTVALPYAILLFIPFIYLWLKNINKSYFLIFLILAVVVLGGFSYIRNFIETLNPLYPLQFNLFGKTIFKGVMDIYTYGAHFKIEDYRLGKTLFHEKLGIQTLIFILPFIFLTLPITIMKKRKVLNFYLIYFFILPILIYLVYRFVIPLANVRYLYPLLGIGIISGFYALDILKVPKFILNILVIICVLSSMSWLAKSYELATSIILTFLLFFTAPYLTKNIKLAAIFKRRIFIVLFSVALLFALILLKQRYLKNEYSGYIKMVKYSGFWPDATKAWDWLNRNTTGNNIAYVGRPVPFPLYGTNFKNNVYYVSVNRVDPVKLYYFPDSHYNWGYDFLSLHKNLEEKGNYRCGPDYSVWLNNLRKHDTDYLFIYSLHQTKEIVFPLEDKWAEVNTSSFRSVFANETIHIYKILK